MEPDNCGTPLVSVVVCTYNRSHLVVGAVRRLLSQTAREGSYEVIVVDNNSRDRTRQVVLQLAEHSKELRYAFEPRQGLAYARNAGWKDARGRFVAYVDDDCRVPETWVQTLVDLVREREPDVIGGPYVPSWESAPPDWVGPGFGQFELGRRQRWLKEGEYLSGGNLAFRKELLEEFGGFDPKWGMRGRTVGYGEETEFQLRLWRNRHDVKALYDPQLEVEHIVRPAKFGLYWNMRSAFAAGRSSHALFSDQEPSLAAAVTKLSRSVFGIGVSLLLGLRDVTAYREHLHEDVVPRVRRLGWGWGSLMHVLRRLT